MTSLDYLGRGALCFLFILLSSFLAEAQLDSISDTTHRGRRILIVPYYPNNYINNDNRALSEYNEMSAIEVEKAFKQSLVANLLTTFRGEFRYGENVMYHSGDSVFRYVGYKMDKCFKKINKEPMKERLSFKRLKARVIDGEGKDDPKEFMAIDMHDSAYFHHLCKSQQIDYVLFINQMEIYTDFHGAQDRSTNDFYRLFRIHFQMMDGDLKSLVGGYVDRTLETSTRDLEHLVPNSIPALSEQILLELFK